ncbi:hypothetical protein [Companilactobacillus zhongbaensis]|uniref:hypothetical protein n=1 Tax=Companilactobacillus zhongbaensis TaxID=2486009 RepID=UPI000F7B0490|nr:hypothetical protein [Companilactobacillus zhongbaensis]
MRRGTLRTHFRPQLFGGVATTKTGRASALALTFHYISKLGLFVSTAFAEQTKISRLTANSLHPPQNLELVQIFLACGGNGTYFNTGRLFWFNSGIYLFFGLKILGSRSILLIFFGNITEELLIFFFIRSKDK